MMMVQVEMESKILFFSFSLSLSLSLLNMIDFLKSYLLICSFVLGRFNIFYYKIRADLISLFHSG